MLSCDLYPDRDGGPFSVAASQDAVSVETTNLSNSLPTVRIPTYPTSHPFTQLVLQEKKTCSSVDDSMIYNNYGE